MQNGIGMRTSLYTLPSFFYTVLASRILNDKRVKGVKMAITTADGWVVVHDKPINGFPWLYRRLIDPDHFLQPFLPLLYQESMLFYGEILKVVSGN